MRCGGVPVAGILREDLRVNLHRPDRQQTATLLTGQRGRVGGVAIVRFVQPFRLVGEPAGWAGDRGGQDHLARLFPPIRFVRSVGARRGGAVFTRHGLVGGTIRLVHGSCPFLLR
jgi:hypothetical protein